MKIIEIGIANVRVKFKILKISFYNIIIKIFLPKYIIIFWTITF